MDPDPLSALSEDQRRRLAAARLVALDVDGVLTDGRIVYGGTDEVQRFDVRDGQGLVWLRDAGVRVVWITGRGCLATERRAQELGVLLVTGVASKRDRLRRVQESLDVPPDETVAMGDDLPDLGLAARAGLFAAPADARREVRERAHLVTAAPGGRGAVRELCEAVLAAQGRWRALVDGAGG